MNQDEFNSAETESKLRMELIAQQEKYKTGWPLGDPREFFNQPQREWVGLTDEHKEGLICMTDPNPEPHHLRELIDVVEFQLKERNT